MVTTVGTGRFTYEVEEDWAKLPEGWHMPAAAVSVDSQDRVFCFNRDPDHPIAVFDRHGNFLYSWGSGLIAFAHAILLDKNDNVWLVDRNHGQIYKYTDTGELLMTIGEKGFRSDTGADPENFGADTYKQVTHAGGPFNLPAGIALNDAGEIFIADGYANCQVHKFSSEGEHLLSWGEPGTGPGQFNLPHGAWVDKQGRVLIADRENDRIQVFTQDGEYLSTWPSEVIGAALVYVDDEDIAYVPEHNAGLVSVLTLDGERLARWGSEIHRSCHGIWLDSHKDVYVVRPGDWGRDRRVVKLHRK